MIELAGTTVAVVCLDSESMGARTAIGGDWVVSGSVSSLSIVTWLTSGLPSGCGALTITVSATKPDWPALSGPMFHRRLPVLGTGLGMALTNSTALSYVSVSTTLCKMAVPVFVYIN